MNYHRYFTFGSNVNTKQLKDRCPSAIFIQEFSLRNYKLVFNRFSKMRNGGVASIIQTGNPNDFVWGKIFLISSDDMISLDRKEGLGAGYSRKFNKTNEFWYYCVTKNDDIFIQPTNEYLNLIIEGLKENFLVGEEYINNLEKLKINE